MLCNNYLSSTGLDGSTAQSRVTAQGYTASVVVENLYALHPAFGMSPQVALRLVEQEHGLPREHPEPECDRDRHRLRGR
ncbi:MAG: hypothetical protein MZV64_17700 [Ignavibacteriales bacterium]|nr:hypothetical protein [Ignavibacteriales bacterium]